ncbi:MAG: radical SAM protein [Pseudomonadota bacterium]
MQHVDSPNQILGRSQTIGCVAVEITQRCNLDCTLCYLSEHSESVRDLPLEEIHRRLDDVIIHFGAGTHVQITGGDPTLRKHRELVEIVRYAASIGLRPALFTNGIAASRKLLEQLAEAGLSDIAFHVDTTQRRKGYADEQSLNALRAEYLERTRGLDLMVIFNTTIHTGNFADLPCLVAFFRDHAEAIGLVSFNLQAETGRGEWGQRKAVINLHTVKSCINDVAGQKLPWDAVRVGHRECHTYMPTVVANRRIHPVVDDADLVAQFLRDFPELTALPYRDRAELVMQGLGAILRRPGWWVRALRYGCQQLTRLGPDLVRSGGQAHKLTFFVQNFMDAKKLDSDRVRACSFMVMTAEGPVSMCEHNATRDEYILKPLDVVKADGSVEHFEPLVWADQSGGQRGAR